MPINYKPLAYAEFETRILEILPNPTGNTIRCRLQAMSLLNPSPYVALSYCWGSEVAGHFSIVVDDIEQSVTKNLFNALEKLRALEVKHVWVDALCINQSDKQEKSLQIRSMTAIYANSEMTYAWLGQGQENHTEKGIEFLQSLANSSSDKSNYLNTLHTCTKSDIQTDTQHAVPPQTPVSTPVAQACECCEIQSCFVALRHLFERPYWRRYWIIQEVSAAIEIKIMYGMTSISLRDMRASLSHCMASLHWGSRLAFAKGYFDAVMQFRQLYSSAKRPTLLKAMSLSSGFSTSEPKDAVFSLLGLTSDGQALIPIPNYFQSNERLTTDLTRALIRYTRRLNIFEYIQDFGSESMGSSSWTVDWLAQRQLTRAPRDVDTDGIQLQEDVSLGRDQVLQVSGIAIGRISATTKALHTGCRELEIVDPLAHNAATVSEPILRRSAKSRYYKSPLQIKQRLTACIISAQRVENRRIQDILEKFWRCKLAWHAFYDLYVSKYWMWSKKRFSVQTTELEDSQSHSLQRWAVMNGAFRIDGINLADCFNNRRAWFVQVMKIVLPIFRLMPYWIDDVWALYMPTVFSIILATWVLGLGIAFKAVGACVAGSLLLLVPLLLTLTMIDSFWIAPYQHLKHGGAKPIISKQVDAFLSCGYLLATTESNILCTVPQNTQVGDEVYYLIGKARPVILRKSEGEGTNCWPKYKLVGNAYVAFNEPDEAYYEGFWSVNGQHRRYADLFDPCWIRPDPEKRDFQERYKKDPKWQTIQLI